MHLGVEDARVDSEEDEVAEMLVVHHRKHQREQRFSKAAVKQK